jgi:hypothetical protein
VAGYSAVIAGWSPSIVWMAFTRHYRVMLVYQIEDLKTDSDLTWAMIMPPKLCAMKIRGLCWSLSNNSLSITWLDYISYLPYIPNLLDLLY